MSERLTLSRAARAAGVSRRELQRKIEAGALESFEGAVLQHELFEVFPAARPAESAEIRRVREIIEAALHKTGPEDSPSEFAVLRTAVEKLESELEAAQARASDYELIIETLTDKLLEVQGDCDLREQMMLESVIAWGLRAVKLVGKPRGSVRSA